MKSQSYSDIKEFLPSEVRIIGLGESTHGSHNLLTLREDLFEALKERFNFSGIIIETPSLPAKAINEWVLGSSGNPENLVSKMGYKWVTRTKEMVSLISKVREYNLISDQKIQLYGCDIEINDNRRKAYDGKRDQAMANACLNLLEDGKTFLLCAHNFHIGNCTEPFPTMGNLLKKSLGDKYFSIAGLFGIGAFNAWGFDPDKDEHSEEVTPFEISEAIPDTWESQLNNTDSDIVFGLTRNLSYRGLLRTYSIGSAFPYGDIDPTNEDFFPEINLFEQFDAYIYLRTSSASHLL